MNAEEVLLLTPRDVAGLLTIDDCIGAVEQAFRLYGEGKAIPPGVLSMHMGDGGFHVKAGVLDVGRHYFAAKVNGNFPENPARFGLPTIQGVIVLCDARKGNPLAVMDSRDVTSLRTAAATAVAAKHLARSDSRILTICGCGNQGRVQAVAISRVCRLQRVFTYDTSAEQAERLAQELAAELRIPVTAVSDLATGVQQSDICVTCTTSRQPILALGDVSPGTFIAAVGADNPEKQEIHPDLMANWPFAQEYEMTYTLANGVLEVTTAVINLSAQAMPVVLGFHPYFRLPDVPRSEAAAGWGSSQAHLLVPTCREHSGMRGR